MLDPLSDVLRSVRLMGGVFIDAHFTAPWCIATDLTLKNCRQFLEQPAQLVQLIAYHVVIEGKLLVSMAGEPATEVCAGEIVLFPRNDRHVMASGPGMEPVSVAKLIQRSASGGLTRLTHGGGGAPTHIVCGFLGSEEGYNPLIASLPRVLTLDVRQGMSRDWIEASVRFAATELAEGKLATSSVMSRLSELLFVEAVRNYSSRLGDQAVGWLKGLRDPQVGRALALMHQRIGEPWSAEVLAKEAALSRSAFMDRFTSLVGMPPIRYLTVWRLEIAKLQLRETAQSIGQLAHSVGYESEEAFSRAFKREFGLSPARWRDGNNPATQTDMP
ncbi:MAG TPA: AraC family transcriptional regulator [Hyphomicrobiaceae bacterium]|jgi:AraC-like DNA-binding protein|nr:AraC family transcriptional regulator [Hyphomicrobiaceae bacterium]